jgi:hypothetical protein
VKKSWKIFKKKYQKVFAVSKYGVILHSILNCKLICRIFKG